MTAEASLLHEQAATLQLALLFALLLALRLSQHLERLWQPCLAVLMFVDLECFQESEWSYPVLQAPGSKSWASR